MLPKGGEEEDQQETITGFPLYDGIRPEGTNHSSLSTILV
jgi:hypothetical protein